MVKKVLHVLSSLDRNGTETFIMNVFRCIDRSKIMFDFLIFTESTVGYYQEALSLGAHIYRLPPRSKGFFSYMTNLRNFFKQFAHDYKCIHFSGSTLTTILPLYYAKKFDIPMRIIHAHSSSYIGIHNLILHKFNSHILPFVATKYLACSEVAAEWFFSNIKDKYLIVKNGIAVSKFQYNQQVRIQQRNLLGINDSFVIGHVGNFNKIKNHNFILDVFCEIRKKISNAKLLLIGDGELFNSIQERVVKEKLEQSVIFLGCRDDVNCLLQAMDCFIFPSLYEGLPFALIEAQAASLPVFASTNVSVEAKLTNNVHFIDLNLTKSAWADYIINHSFIERKSTRETIENLGYSIEKTTEILFNIYNENCN